MSLKPKIFKNSAEKKSDFFLFAVPTGVDACAGQVEKGRGMETREKEEGIYKKKVRLCSFSAASPCPCWWALPSRVAATRSGWPKHGEEGVREGLSQNEI